MGNTIRLIVLLLVGLGAATPTLGQARSMIRSEGSPGGLARVLREMDLGRDVVRAVVFSGDREWAVIADGGSRFSNGFPVDLRQRITTLESSGSTVTHAALRTDGAWIVLSRNGRSANPPSSSDPSFSDPAAFPMGLRASLQDSEPVRSFSMGADGSTWGVVNRAGVLRQSGTFGEAFEGAVGDVALGMRGLDRVFVAPNGGWAMISSEWMASEGLPESVRTNLEELLAQQRSIDLLAFSSDDRWVMVSNGKRAARLHPFDRLEKSIFPAGATTATSLRARMNQLAIPGLSIAVVRDFQLVGARGYGKAVKGTAKWVSPRTIFQAASVSKPVTAVGVLALVGQGRLALGGDFLDPSFSRQFFGETSEVNAWLARQRSLNPPPIAGRLTLSNILSHNAGLLPWGYGGRLPGAATPSLSQLLAGVSRGPTQATYAGGGYTLLQAMVEERAGAPFARWMSNTVLRPYSMNASYFGPRLPSRNVYPFVANGFTNSGGPLTVPSDGNPRTTPELLYPELAAAGLHTSALDLANFLLGVAKDLDLANDPTHQRIVLPTTTARRLMTPLTNANWCNDSGAGRFSMGFCIRGSGNTLRMVHGGENTGFNSYIALNPTTGNGVALMANRNSSAAFLQEVVKAVEAAFGFSSLR